MADKILTKHPDQKKKGVNISKEKYDVIRNSILDSLKGGEVTYSELSKAIREKLRSKFQGSIPWYVEVVKLDLEATGVIERIPKTTPQLYRLVK